MRPTLENDQAVKTFNSLANAGVPNEWHIDLRYIALNPPSHILLFLHRDSLRYRITVIEEDSATGAAFFPETAKEAAPQIARAILNKFNEYTQTPAHSLRIQPYAPQSITLEDYNLAHELEQEFIRIGVREDRCNIFSTSSSYVCKLAHETFEHIHRRLMERSDYEPFIQDALTPSTCIMLPSIHPEETSDLWTMYLSDDMSNKVLKYAHAFANSRPPGAADADFESERLLSDMEKDEALFTAKPESVVRREADSGSGFACLDYAMRLKFGIGCRSNRFLCRVYLMKALSCERAMNNRMRATAHALLTDWFFTGCGGGMPPRYVFWASHHAQEAIKLSRKYSKKGDLPAAPAVLRFALFVFEKLAIKNPVLLHLYRSVWEVAQERKKQVADADERMVKRRLKEPYSYHCAAEGCVIQADAKRMLKRCAGKCDPDKKPSYCSKECQKADWPNHKPYCKPGAECSVIDDGSYDASSGGRTSKNGTLNVPVTHSDGSTIYLNSSSISPSVMKEVKETIEAELSGGFGFRAPFEWVTRTDSDSDSELLNFNDFWSRVGK